MVIHFFHHDLESFLAFNHWKWSESENHSVMSNSLWPHGLYSPWNSPGQNTGVGSLSLPGDLPNPGIEPRSPILQADSLPSEPPGKPKNTGVGSLSVLQWIFLTEESNWGLLHCRWILYQLNYDMWNVGLDESQAEIKIARRNINNPRYADVTTLLAESKEKLRSLLMKLKEESGKS